MKELRILVADDDVSIGESLAELLRLMGHCVCAVATTEAGAVMAALQHRPDLMIIDARLGGGSGVAAVETILRTTWIAHLFISGGRVAAGKAVVLHKPFREADLTASMQRALDASMVGTRPRG